MNPSRLTLAVHMDSIWVINFGCKYGWNTMLFKYFKKFSHWLSVTRLCWNMTSQVFLALNNTRKKKRFRETENEQSNYVSFILIQYVLDNVWLCTITWPKTYCKLLGRGNLKIQKVYSVELLKYLFIVSEVSGAELSIDSHCSLCTMGSPVTDSVSYQWKACFTFLQFCSKIFQYLK